MVFRSNHNTLKPRLHITYRWRQNADSINYGHDCTTFHLKSMLLHCVLLDTVLCLCIIDTILQWISLRFRSNKATYCWGTSSLLWEYIRQSCWQSLRRSGEGKNRTQCLPFPCHIPSSISAPTAPKLHWGKTDKHSTTRNICKDLVHSEPLLGLFELWTLGACYQSMWK